MTTEHEVHTDRRGRVLDRDGRPLRNRDLRSYTGPFKGSDGTVKENKRLEARQQSFDEWSKRNVNSSGRRRPGSGKK